MTDISVVGMQWYRQPTAETLAETYSDVFTGLGQYDEPYKIVLDPAVPPVIQSSRKVPFSKLSSLRTALDQLKHDGVVTSIDRPTYGTQSGHYREEEQLSSTMP